MNIAKYSLDNPKVIYFFLFVMLIGGVISFGSLGKKEDSPFVIKTAVLITQYPGASPKEVEQLITEPIEREIQSMRRVYKIKSDSYYGMSKINIELSPATPPEEMPQMWDELRRKVLNVQSQLPQGASDIKVSDDFGDVFGIYFSLTADEGFSYHDLREWGQRLKTELVTIEGVQKVALFGEQTEVVNVFISMSKLANSGINLNSLMQTIKSQNSLINTGEKRAGNIQLKILAEGTYKNLTDIRNQLISTETGQQIRLGDIAVIEKGYMEPPSTLIRVNGRKGIGIGVSTAPDYDVVKAGEAVRLKLAQLEEQMPVGIEMVTLYPEDQIAREANNGFILNLIESVVIVVAILMLTMGFRSGMIIGISLVVTVVGSFLILGMADGTMQRVSLAAFILAMGMLVDNAIVIVDGILIDLKLGKPRREAMTAIGRKTAMPLLGATLIAILSFLPIFLSPDTAGVYVRDLFIVLAVSLLLSWVLALVHVPLMADAWLGQPAAPAGGATLYDSAVYRWLRAALGFGLRHRWSSIAVALVLVGLSVWGYGYMRQGFFPDMVYDQLYMEYKLPAGTNSTRVKADLEEIRRYLKSRPEIRSVAASIGGTPARYNLVRSIATPSLSYGELIIDFESPEALERNIDDIQQTLSDRYPDAYVKLKRYNLMFKKYPIEVQFTGPDPAVLHRLADSARCIMERTPEVCLITTDWEPRIPVLNIDYDQSAARRMGLSRQDIAVSMLSAAGGIPVGAFYEGTHKNTIYLKCTEADGKPVDNLENVPVFPMMPNLAGLFDEELLLKLKSGAIDRSELLESVLHTVPLRQVSRGVQVEWEDPVVPRYNGQRAQRVMCSPAPGIETEAARLAVAERIEAIPLPSGYALSWEGEKGASDETMRYLFKNVPLGVVLMIAILILLFGDYRKPAVILCCIPLLGIGVVGAMLLTGKVFTFCAIVGALGLVGMMMKNCIVLMDEIGAQIAAGADPASALVSSSESRLRPVMMASLTTILGMIPLLGDAMFGSMAATIMGGLLFSTFATLFFVPILYALFFKIRIDR